MLIEDAHTDCGESNDEPAAVWAEAESRNFSVSVSTLSTQHLLLLYTEKSDGSVETASHECVSIIWSKADLAWYIHVIKDLYGCIVLALQTPQDDLVVEAAREDQVFIF